MSKPRTLIVCFDGTMGHYDATNTNVVKLFSLLKKDNKDEQLVYYQTGIGTYASPGMIGTAMKWIAKVVDEAVAWYIDTHITGGYRYLMQNYNEGDRICIFGFSRGAYTARALGGMLHKVGLLSKDNEEQIGFAYNVYKATGKDNTTLAEGFKRTFSTPVRIEFIGCWDTVSSVGAIWSRHLPFTNGTTTIKTFRHALSLDEHRAKFQANTWHKCAPDEAAASKDPEHGSAPAPKKPTNEDQSEDDSTDVLEVWFAGCHSDVGGGATRDDDANSLSNITLRWMVREIVKAQCGIQFDPTALKRAGIPLTMVYPDSVASDSNVQSGSSGIPQSSDGEAAKATAVEVTGGPSPSLYNAEAAQDDVNDAKQQLHDEFLLNPAWWILEVMLFYQPWQDESGTWHRQFRWNLGRGRIIVGDNPNLHITVQQRMQNTSLAYTPRAQWKNKPNAKWIM
ncbi:hypothetical protein BU17DRAFT_39727 [Hysterangium stoloniferum]|nr:hypothetical protein BU17DRAFT_39727 [Hysterangium stoloniferum]